MATNPQRQFLVQASAAVAALLAGCASTRIDASWSDPQLAPNSLRGARVMVACEAYDQVIKRICQDQLVAEVVARGATPVIAPDIGNAAPDRPPGNEQYLNAARNAGAKALLTHTITAADVIAAPGYFSIGLGGFGIGGGGGSMGGGVGVTAPINSGRTNTGYAMSSSVTETTSGRLVWLTKASASPSSDANGQLTELTKAVFGAADKAKVF